MYMSNITLLADHGPVLTPWCHGPVPRRLLDDASPTPTVYINWGKFGEYELVISEDGMSMSGSAKGNAANWRKATRMGGIDAGEDANSHNH